MKRVRITQEQADAVEWMVDKLREDHERFKRNHQCNLDVQEYTLLEMATSDYMAALRGNYEVKRELNVGDCIVRKDGSLFYITHRGGGFPRVVKIEGFVESSGIDFIIFNGGNMIISDEVRLATQGEVEAEKERNWWVLNMRGNS